MTLAQLQRELEKRDLALTIHSTTVVWAFAADDPALGVFPGEGETLEEAVAAALDAWDTGTSEGEENEETTQ